MAMLSYTPPTGSCIQPHSTPRIRLHEEGVSAEGRDNRREKGFDVLQGHRWGRAGWQWLS